MLSYEVFLCYFRTAVKLRFYARLEKEVSFNVLLQVQFKSMPLKVNLKAVGYGMDSQLFYIEGENEKMELSHSQINEIDFGEVNVILKSFCIKDFFCLKQLGGFLAIKVGGFLLCLNLK